MVLYMSVRCCLPCFCVFFFKQKTAYEMRISDWSSDVCSSDLNRPCVVGKQRACDTTRRCGRTGERDAGDADVRHQRLPNVGATRHEVQHLTRHTGLEQQTHGTCGDQRCLWCRFGDDGVTRKQRRTDLADEDRQREVPRTDAREYDTAEDLQFIALAGRPRPRQRREQRLKSE